MKKILLIGGGGHCRSVLDTLTCCDFDDIGLVDIVVPDIPGVQYAGTDDDLPKLREQGWEYAFITVGSIGETTVRRKIYQRIQALNFTIPKIIDSSAAIARSSEIGAGVFIGKNAVVNAGARIGNCAIINTGALVEHECRVGDFAHISSGVVLCGQVTVGEDTHIGAGTVIRQCISVGAQTLIGIGSVVTRNIPDHVKAYGNPCRMVKE